MGKPTQIFNDNKFDMSSENGKLTGRLNIEQNLAFTVNVYSDDILEQMLGNILQEMSDVGSVYNF